MRVKLDIENKTIIRLFVVALAFYLGLAFVVQIRGAIVLLIISAFLAMALNPPVSYLAKKVPGGSRGLATGIAYLLVLTALGAFIYATVPPLVDESRKLIETIPERIEDFRESSNDGVVADFIDRYNLDQEAEELADTLTSRLGDVTGPIISGIGTVTGAIVSFLTVLVLTFLMLVEGPQWLELFWSYIPASKREHHQGLARRMYRVVTGYVNGQLLIALIAGTTALIMMLIVGLPNPIALGGLVAIFGLIPLIGATLGSIIITIIAAFQSLSTAVVMLLFFIIYQQIENNIIQPYVQSRTLDMSPLLVFVAVILGFNAGGLLGGFIAIPTAGALRILALDKAEEYKAKNAKKLGGKSGKT
ncbi:MAG: AI-2E family transporter [Candidatus Saccharimonadales bacterium]|nr:AI-2E family transporter [Candidatus Saccharimonadales bacterium]